MNEPNVVITMDSLFKPEPQQCHDVVPSIFFSVHPLADVRRTILQIHAIRLAIP
jgi:hypothetical protein